MQLVNFTAHSPCRLHLNWPSSPSSIVFSLRAKRACAGEVDIDTELNDRRWSSADRTSDGGGPEPGRGHDAYRSLPSRCESITATHRSLCNMASIQPHIVAETKFVPPSDPTLPALALQVTRLRDSYMLWIGTTEESAEDVQNAPLQGHLARDWACAMPANKVRPTRRCPELVADRGAG